MDDRSSVIFFHMSCLDGWTTGVNWCAKFLYVVPMFFNSRKFLEYNYRELQRRRLRW